MQRQAEHVLHLVDAQEHQVGQIVVERREANLVFGRFVPGPAFSSVQPLFQQFEEAVNCQALSVVDELDAAIAALGLYVHMPDDSQPIEAQDVQIWSDGSITCRVGSSTLSAKDQDQEGRQSVRTVKEEEGHLTNSST